MGHFYGKDNPRMSTGFPKNDNILVLKLVRMMESGS